jgi:hypothetical protein
MLFALRVVDAKSISFFVIQPPERPRAGGGTIEKLN